MIFDWTFPLLFDRVPDQSKVKMPIHAHETEVPNFMCFHWNLNVKSLSYGDVRDYDKKKAYMCLHTCT